MSEYTHSEVLRQEVTGLEIGQTLPRDVYTSMSRQTLDIIRLRKMLDEAHIDVVTKLPNRFSFDKRFDRLFWRAKQEKDSVLGLMVADLDHLKEVNDTQGHGKGDEYLKTVAEALQSVLRPQDQVYRVGGDEFIAILPGIKPQESEQNNQLERIKLRARLTVAEALDYSDLPHGMKLGVSLGIGIVLPEDLHPAEPLNRVDGLMYDDKRQRRQ